MRLLSPESSFMTTSLRLFQIHRKHNNFRRLIRHIFSRGIYTSSALEVDVMRYINPRHLLTYLPHGACNMPPTSRTRTYSNCGVVGVMIDPCDYCRMLPQCHTCWMRLPKKCFPIKTKANTCDMGHVLSLPNCQLDIRFSHYALCLFAHTIHRVSGN